MLGLARFFRGKPKWARNACAPRATLGVEHLESRLAPVVGAYAQPAVIVPPGQYDGVVSIGVPHNITGSLIATATGWSRGHHILTVAHAIGAGPLPVRFDLSRASNTNRPTC